MKEKIKEYINENSYWDKKNKKTSIEVFGFIKFLEEKKRNKSY